MGKFLIVINEEDNTLDQMSKQLNAKKADIVLMAINVLDYILDQRKVGQHLTFTNQKDCTYDILKDAINGEIPFKLN